MMHDLAMKIEEETSSLRLWDWDDIAFEDSAFVRGASAESSSSTVDVEHCNDLTVTFDGTYSLTLYCNGRFFGKYDHPELSDVDLHAMYTTFVGDLSGCVKHIEVWKYELNSAQVAAYVNENKPDEWYPDLIAEPSDTCGTNKNLCHCRFGAGHGVISMLILDYDVSPYKGFTIDSATYFLEEKEDLVYEGPVRVLLLTSAALSWADVEPLMENALKSDWVDKDGSTWEVQITDLVQSCVDDPTSDLSNARFLIQVDPHFGFSIDYAHQSYITIEAHNSGSYMPTVNPSNAPTTSTPTQQPSTEDPSMSPSTEEPTRTPSMSPSTEDPSKTPSASPSTEEPSKTPSVSPSTEEPTHAPSSSPSVSPSTEEPSL